MATRGTYIIEGPTGGKIEIYRHYDNYPSGAFEFLLKLAGGKDINDIFKKSMESLTIDILKSPSAYLSISSGIEYTYKIDLKNKKITAYKIDWDNGDKPVEIDFKKAVLQNINNTIRFMEERIKEGDLYYPIDKKPYSEIIKEYEEFREVVEKSNF